MVRVLSDSDVASVLDLEALLPIVADAFERQYVGAVTRPDRPHYPIGTGLNPTSRRSRPELASVCLRTSTERATLRRNS